jgi:hypothetical protein
MDAKRDQKLTELEMLLTGDSSSAIMNQEARGQRQFNSSDVLPRDMHGNTREQFESLGFVFGEVVDDLFIQATLPTGWQKKATSHSMHSIIVDDKGRERVGIFYKAAFYDRVAHMSLSRRYSYGCNPVTGWGDAYDSNADREGVVCDQGEIIWRSEIKAKRDDFKLTDKLEAEAKAWLEASYPDWKNDLAYWD